MIWDYRIIKHIDASRREEWLAIHTVFYNARGEATSYSQEPESCIASDIEDLRVRTDMMRSAFDREILIARSLDAKIGRKRNRSERNREREHPV